MVKMKKRGVKISGLKSYLREEEREKYLQRKLENMGEVGNFFEIFFMNF